MGRVMLEDNNAGEAMNYFQQALNKKRGIYPEAEIAIGDLFKNSEYELALLHYNAALKYKSAFLIPDNIYEVFYKISNIYKVHKNYLLMQQYLNNILNDSSFYSNKRYSHLRDSILSTYTNKGIDHLLKLYRFSEGFAIKAHSDLGWFYYKTGKNSYSILNYLFSIISIVSESVEELRLHDPDYEFSSLSNILNISSKIDNISDFLEGTEFFKSLYYLACATYAHGQKELSVNIYKIIINSNYKGKYRNLSIRQINHPWVENYINPSPRKIQYPSTQ